MILLIHSGNHTKIVASNTGNFHILPEIVTALRFFFLPYCPHAFEVYKLHYQSMPT